MFQMMDKMKSVMFLAQNCFFFKLETHNVRVKLLSKLGSLCIDSLP